MSPDAINPFGPKTGLPLVETNLGTQSNQASEKGDATNKPEMSIPPQVSKPDESQPQDPTKAILEQNVKANLAIEKAASNPKLDTVSLSKSMRIKRILLSSGMDSQQAGKALNDILETIQS